MQTNSEGIRRKHDKSVPVATPLTIPPINEILGPDFFVSRFEAAIAGVSVTLKKWMDRIRVAYWTCRLKARTRRASAYGNEKHLEPEAFKTGPGGDPYHGNKWGPYYSLGLHVPRLALVQRVDRRRPGSRYELEHVIWVLPLNPDKVAKDPDAYLSRLLANFQKLVFKEEQRRLGWVRRRRPVTERTLLILEHRASLDSLACLTILALAAQDLGEHRAAMRVAHSLWRTFLIVGAFDPGMREIGTSLFTVFSERIFSRFESDGYVFDFSRVHYHKWCLIVRTLTLAWQEIKGTQHWKSHAKIASDVLRGHLSRKCRWALVPPKAPSNSSKEDFELRRKRCENQERTRAWAMKELGFSKFLSEPARRDTV